MKGLVFRTATELARVIRDRKASCLEVIDEHLRHIKEHNERLNAVVTLDEEGALRRAREADEALAQGIVWGPMHGVPVTVKDSYETNGLRTTAGFPPLKEYILTHDATVVSRLRSAGAIILGKTNLSLLATNLQANNPVFGRTNNPWDQSRTVGGSSGGSAAAIAAGFSALDIAGDIGGSIRVPAHYCGIYGLKPSEHSVSSYGYIPDWGIPGMTPPGIVRHMGTYGPLARSVEDLRLCFDVIRGPDNRQHEVFPYSISTASTPQPLEDLRIAWTDQFGSSQLSADTRAVLEKLIVILEENGVRAEQVKPKIDFDRVWRTWGEISAAEIGGPMPFFLRNMMRVQFMLMKDRSPMRKGILRGVDFKAKQMAAALADRDKTINDINAILENYDVWVCPVTPAPAFTHRKSGSAIEVDGRKMDYFLATAGYTTPFNVSGHPSVVLPAGSSKEGLPIGVQLVGAKYRDEVLLSIAASLDQRIGGYECPPGYNR